MATLKEELKDKLSEGELQKLISSYDILGSIAIIEIPPELAKKEKLIGNTILAMHKNIKTVLKKAGMHKGRFRRQQLKVVAGKRTKTAEYRENGTILKLDVEKVYFSPRLSTERKRVYEQVKAGEKVLVMFSGCAPYVAVIAKNTKSDSVYGIELNPVAHRFAEENIKANKIKNAVLINGDAAEECKKLSESGILFDRIVMPLPKDAGSFLDSAFSVAKKGAVIHFYDFGREDEYAQKSQKIIDECSRHCRKCRILGITKCGNYSPRVFRLCIDFVLS